MPASPMAQVLSPAAPARQSRLGILAAGAVVAIAGVAAYAGTLHVPFLFDDLPSIVDNTTIRHLASSLSPPADTTVSGRPLVNVSLALDYALGGNAPAAYHVTNLLIHVAAALLLLGLVRRTLDLGRSGAVLPIALCAALLWVVHPLGTESVTYVVQRAESLMGLLYLATLYCFLRGATGAAGWFLLSVVSCFLGMATKETMASAPLVVLLFDRTFLAGTFRDAIGLRWKTYCGLAASWVLLGCLILSTHGRTGTVGFGGGVSALSYAATQAWAVAHYLRLCFWPNPLVFDYGRALSVRTSDIVAGGLIVAVLLAATLWALVRRPALGFLGVLFFAVLAPSSSFIPVLTETVAEHRMYLALIPVIVFVVAAGFRWLPRAAAPLCALAALALLVTTWRRNETYRSAEALWRSVVAARPANERAHNNLGFILAGAPGGRGEAILQYQRALELAPRYAQAHLNLAMALVVEPGRLEDAVAEFRRAAQLDPSLVDAHFNLGRALMAIPGHMGEAEAEYEEVIRLRPGYAEAHYNLGCAFGATPGGTKEAIAQYREALRINPALAEAHFNLGCSLAQEPGRVDEAINEFEATLKLSPRYVPALCNLATALGSVGRREEALASAKEALRLDPGSAAANAIMDNLRGTLR